MPSQTACGGGHSSVTWPGWTRSIAEFSVGQWPGPPLAMSIRAVITAVPDLLRSA
jgi:hypothetical protein